MNKTHYIDINCDVGEGVGNERDLLPLISSCSIACGGHAGNTASMREVIRLAKANHVRIGAHPSYPDKENFGRRSMNISEDELIASIQKQIADLSLIINEEKAQLNHIKPHGALYNDLAKDDQLVKVFLKAIAEYKNSVTLYAPFESVLAKRAVLNGFKVTYEAFADRNYNDDLSLVSRKQGNALITEPKAVLEHILRLVKKQQVKTVGNLEIDLKAETLCLHGDTPNALEILQYLRTNMTSPQVNIQITK